MSLGLLCEENKALSADLSMFSVWELRRCKMLFVILGKGPSQAMSDIGELLLPYNDALSSSF